MHVFLAGATSVIGSPLVPQLLRAGHRVTAMTRSVLRGAQLEAAGADPVVCDVFDAEGVREAMAAASPDAVIHQLTAMPTRLDWGNPELFKEHNRVRAEGARILLDAARIASSRRASRSRTRRRAISSRTRTRRCSPTRHRRWAMRSRPLRRRSS